MTEDILECPKCKKMSLHVQHPDEYEVWLKCSECDYFRGMSKDEWHRLENSPNLEKKIKKFYEKEKKAEQGTGDTVCRGCRKSFDRADMGPFGFFCKKCWYKFLIVVFVLMVISSYMVWMMLL